MQYPRDDQSFIAWARQRADTWTGGQSGTPDIGITDAQAAAYDLLVSAGESALSSQTAAQAAAKASTVDKKNAFEAIREELGALISTIEAYAKVTRDESVYARAQLDPPKEPGERPAPETPVITSADLGTGGSVLVRFAVTTGGAAVFDVQRQVTPVGGEPTGWTTVASVTDKTFTDGAVPFGVRSVAYRVRARLTNGASSTWSNPSTVPLGSPQEEPGQSGAQGGTSQAA
ncbi:MAG: hypothetical protein AAFV77_05660 [Planctomycetota bacterium]